jgi:hypothetical protein
LYQMPDTAVEPDLVRYNVAISAYEKGKQKE